MGLLLVDGPGRGRAAVRRRRTAGAGWNSTGSNFDQLIKSPKNCQSTPLPKAWAFAGGTVGMPRRVARVAGGGAAADGGGVAGRRAACREMRKNGI
jgi:hypothetical protein